MNKYKLSLNDQHVLKVEYSLINDNIVFHQVLQQDVEQIHVET